MQDKKHKGLIFHRTTGPATLWRKLESSAAQQGLLFGKASAKNKVTRLHKERERHRQTESLFLLCTTPSPLTRDEFGRND